MNFSSTQLLLSIELTFLLAIAWHSQRRAKPQPPTGAVYLYILWIVLFSILAGVLGARGVYVSEALLPWLPGLWLQGVTVAAVVLPVVLFAAVRNGIRRIVDATPWHWFAYFHALRIAAIGTAYKAWIGAFPLAFEIAVGIPDLLFGLSAFWVAAKAKRGEISERGFMIWNGIGFLVIVPAAQIFLQLGLPGPLQVFTALPDSRAVLTYPMSVASMVGVPLFVLINLAVAWRLWERTAKETPGLDTRRVSIK